MLNETFTLAPAVAGTVPAAAPDQPEWAVLVVHGVGDTEPSQTVGALASDLAAAFPALQLPNRYEMVPCDEGDDSFPVFLRRGTTPGGRGAVFAEVYWADLSRIREGAVNLVLGILRIIFGLRHVADQAAAQPGWPARLIRVLLVAAALLLRGPIAALILFLVATALPFWAFPDAFDAGEPAGPAYLVWGLVAAGVGGVLWRKLRRQGRPSATFWGFLALVGLTAAALAGAALASPRWRPLQWLNDQVHGKYEHLPFASWGWHLAALVLGNNWLFEGAIWLMLMALVVLVVAWLGTARPVRLALTAAYLAGALQVGLWVLAVSACDWIILAPLTADLEPERRQHYYTDWTSYVVAQLVLALSLGLAVLLTWGCREVWAWRHPAPPADPRRRPPRLIVAVAVQVLLLLASCAMGLFTLWFAHHPSLAWPAWFQTYTGLILTATVVLLGMGMALFATGLRNALHILMDVINHFHRRDQLLSLFRKDMTTPPGAFQIRQCIEARFRRVLRELLRSHQPTNLAIIAHSQGTIIAIDVLRQKQWAAPLEGLKLVTLLTLGSPFTHIYQHYFPQQYPPLEDDSWQSMRASVDQWVNIFRVDDFVGTDVTSATGAWPVNMPVGYGGHTGYWRQAEVLEIIAQQLPGLAR